jgi:NADH-quinone oxidoreductase subunit J
VALVAFVILAAGAIGGALAVVLQRNALYGALSLVGVFAATAGLYLMLSAPFLAVIQIIVYAGAIMVLFIFVIMLLSLRYEESGEAEGIPRGIRRAVAGLLAAILVALLGTLSFTLVLSGKPGGLAGEDLGSVQAVGLALYQRYMFPFEVASLLLLVAIVGAVAITRRHGRGLEGHVAEAEDA